jgi:DNA polymerase I-like protein with 3'-5' exonuclease and polymerase domains
VLRALVNHVIQASAQGIMKIGMANIWANQFPILQSYGYCEPTLQVHDELMIECAEEIWPVAESGIKHELTHAVQLIVPTEANSACGFNWSAIDK